mgnify:CR=1 FL=1
MRKIKQQYQQLQRQQAFNCHMVFQVNMIFLMFLTCKITPAVHSIIPFNYLFTLVTIKQQYQQLHRQQQKRHIYSQVNNNPI